MAYIINKTNGGILTQVEEQTIDETTSLKLFGRRRADYGEILNENFIKLLENFADDTEPTSPMDGQVWYDTTTASLKYYNGTAWRLIGGVIVSATPPPPGVIGDMWYNTASETRTLHAYDGAEWALIGPESGTITGAVGRNIVDSLDVEHAIIEMRVANDLPNGNTYDVIGIISLDAEFTPDPTIDGYTTLKPGFNMSSSPAAAKFHGTATDSDALGGIAATNYLRSDSNDTTAGTLKVLNDGGLYVGASDDIRFFVDNDTTANFNNDTTDGDLEFRNSTVVTPTYPETAITIDGTTNYVTIHGDLTLEGSLIGYSQLVTSVNTFTGDVILDSDDITQGTTNLYVTTANVNNAGATMNTDSDVSGNSWTDGDVSFTPAENTVVPTQLAVKTYVDTEIGDLNTTLTNLINGLSDKRRFMAYSNVLQNVPSTTYTKILFDTEDIDTHNTFNLSDETWTPGVNGYAIIGATIGYDMDGTSDGEAVLLLYKNGVKHRTSHTKYFYHSAPTGFDATWLVEVADTDTFQLYSYTTFDNTEQTVTLSTTGLYRTSFWGTMLI